MADAFGAELVDRAARALPADLARSWRGCNTIGGALGVLERRLGDLANVERSRSSERARAAEAIGALEAQRERLAGEREALAVARAKWGRMTDEERDERRRRVAGGRAFLREGGALVDSVAIKELAEESEAQLATGPTAQAHPMREPWDRERSNQADRAEV